MSEHQENLDISLLLFQARADDLGRLVGVLDVSTHAHCPSGEFPLYYCRFRLPADPLPTETPAGRTTGAALHELRVALLTRLAT